MKELEAEAEGLRLREAHGLESVDSSVINNTAVNVAFVGNRLIDMIAAWWR
ncbi:hypothetical protein [Sphingobacterium paludis]|uniref:Uncharacterized protein n=1 Tax=Sphingobacterium paludis TaxID=1476465 RepID=A0A4R7CV73_9SPHI|nr:hypothetical protein [Sphingobacterium paludis]TDS08939.1 hypothetical protein B0I21_11168 [Sphingobacterium paludis]